MLEEHLRRELGDKAQWHDWTYAEDSHVLIATGTYQFRDPRNPLPVLARLGRLARRVSPWRPEVYLWTNPAERDERAYVSEGDSRGTFRLLSSDAVEPAVASVHSLGPNRTVRRHRSRLRREASA